MAEIKDKYDHQAQDAKWQKYWDKNKIFIAKNHGQKKYVLDMFPYPSGDGLHVGHPRSYTASDILSHYYRLKGFDVLHPVGFDAFGLPAENAAIKKGIPPAENTAKNIERFSQQLNMLGLSYDWDRQIVTSDPEYYKWTQWLFLQLYKNGLAYQKEAVVNWCPNDKTVLANEQVVGGRCERCGTAVMQEKRTQWFFKITDFAEDLLSGLDDLDWPESTKEIQRNWIGKSEGADIEFKIKNETLRHSSGNNLKMKNGGEELKIKVFTTRPDTLFGATYMVLAPEHPDVDKIVTDEQRQAVQKYQEDTAKKTELDRIAETKDKTGVFTGAYAINPANNQEIPIWVADYVLAGYGYGAVMCVPAHDTRDFEFANKFNLPIIEVVNGGELPFLGQGMLVNSGEFDGMNSKEAGIAITKKVGGKITTKYRLRDWLVSRQRYWGTPIPILYDKDDNPIPIKEEDLPVILPTDVEFKPTGESPLTYSEEFKKVPADYSGVVRREYDTLDTFVCSSWYYMRYADAHNSREFANKDKLKYWLPVDVYIGGAEHATGHLIFARFITKVLHKLGFIEFSEPFIKLRHQGLILGEGGEKMSKSKGNVVNPDEAVEGFGADALRMYEMFVGPFDQPIPWSTAGIEGVKKFLDRTYRLIQERKDLPQDNSKEAELHRLIIKVSSDIETLHFNTAVSSFMIFVNEAIEDGKSSSWVNEFVILLAPFAPHLAEEIWQNVLGNKTSVFSNAWPVADDNIAKLQQVDIVVQEKGKKRGVIRVAAGTDEAVVLDIIKQDSKLAYLIKSGEHKFVPDRIINFF